MINPTPTFSWVDLERLHPNSSQPRLHFDETQLKELAASIAEHGILQPLLCDSNYQIIAGERRWRAAKWLGLKEVPCMIFHVEAGQKAAMSLLENIQRAQMEPLEEALAFKQLQAEFGWTQEHIAKMLGKSRVYVTNILRLLKLSSSVLDALREKVLSYGHARVLVGLNDERQEYFLNYLKQKSCSVRQFEKMVAQDKKNTAPQMDSSDLYLSNHAHFIRDVTELIGTEVGLDYLENGSGWLKFKFYDHDTLSGLLQKLGLGYD